MNFDNENFSESFGVSFGTDDSKNWRLLYGCDMGDENCGKNGHGTRKENNEMSAVTGGV